MHKIYETKRLQLIPTTEKDAAFLVELLNTPKMLKYVGDRKVRTIRDAKEYIKSKIVPQYKNLGYSNYTVIRKSDLSKMGTCGLYDRDGLEGIDIGFAFLPQFEGKGYAIESAIKIRELAFQEFGIDKIIAITSQKNLASRKLLEKLGMSYKSMVQLSNDEEELMLYELSKHS